MDVLEELSAAGEEENDELEDNTDDGEEVNEDDAPRAADTVRSATAINCAGGVEIGRAHV